MTESQTFYRSPGPMTVPGPYARLLDALPGDIAALCGVVQGLMLHVFWAERYGVQLPEARKEELQLRSVSQKLKRLLELDPRPLTCARLPEMRLVGNCRDFSLLLTAFLRHQGIPARARCGFGRYFIPNHYEDHWVCETWNERLGRWVLVDAQLDSLQCEVLGVPFNPLDVPREQFVVAGRAWQLCRSGEADSNSFGIFDMHGLWFVRGNLVRDIAALNNLELLPWDSWGIIERRDEELSEDDLALLDYVASLSSTDPPGVQLLRELYQDDPRLHVRNEVRSYTSEGVRVEKLELKP